MDNFVQLWHASLHLANLPYTLLLILVLLYWMTVMLGLLDMGSVDVDLPGSEGDISSPAAGSFEGILEYFNLRKVPISIVVSFFALSLWLIGVLANHYIHGTRSKILGLLLIIPNVLVSAHVAKILTLPLVPLFRAMRGDASDRRDLVGTRVVVTSSQANATFGTAELRETGAPITLMVRTEGEVLPRGTEAVILQTNPESRVHLITKMEI